MKILVTGDMGKLGSLTTKVLSAAGHKVVGLDIKRGPQEDLLKKRVLIRANGCDCIVHAAGIPHPGVPQFGSYFWTNGMGTLKVAQAAYAAKVKRVVYFSSTGYYGCDVRKGQVTPLYFPIDENHPSGMGPHVQGGYESYNLSKMIAEQTLAYYGTNHLVEVVILRIAPANTKRFQFRKGFNWRTDKSWRRGAFFANTTPSFVAQAAKLAVELKGQQWYSVFHIMDRYVHGSIDVREFLMTQYPEVKVNRTLGIHDSLFSIKKAQEVLGFKPCETLI